MNRSLSLAACVVVVCGCAIVLDAARGQDQAVRPTTASTNQTDGGQRQPVAPSAQGDDQGDRARQRDTQANREQPNDPFREPEVEATIAQAAYARAQTLLAVVGLLLSLAIGWVAWEEHQTNKTSLTTTRLIERAWISVTDLRLQNLGAGLTPGAVVVYKNTGHTPGSLRAVRLKLEVMGADESLPPVPDYSDTGIMAYTTLMPNEEASSVMDYSNSQPLPPFVFEGIETGKAHLYLYGAIEYCDCFEPDRIRVTKYARRYDPAISKANGKPVFVFPKVSGYNEAS